MRASSQMSELHLPQSNVTRRTFMAAAGVSLVATAVGAVGNPLVAQASVTWGYPFTFRSSQSRGFNPGTPHYGIDYTPGLGTPIHAVADGYVHTNMFQGPYGQHVILSHADGYYSIYGHMLEGSNSRASVGTYVPRGALLGDVGSTGRSTGPHLHMEIRRGSMSYPGACIDPYPLLHNAPLANASAPPSEDSVPIYHRRQGNYNVPIGTGANTRLYFADGSFDMAAGAGGSGLYQITTHADFAGLTPEKVLILQYFLLNASTGVYSGGFSATFPGVVGGAASVEFSTMIPVPAGNHLFVAARCPQGGVNQTRVAKMSLNFGNI